MAIKVSMSKLRIIGFIYLALVIGSAQSQAKSQQQLSSDERSAILAPHAWLGVALADRFRPLADYDFEQDPDYQKGVIPYLQTRGVQDQVLARRLVKADCYNLAQALSVLYSANQYQFFKQVLPMSLLEKVRNNAHIDHVGRELFGPIDFYFKVLMQLSPRLGLKHHKLPSGVNVTKQGNLLFLSTSVVKEIARYNSNVKAVGIGRIYFSPLKGNALLGNLELFQLADLNRQYAQPYENTLIRMANLYVDSTQGLYPFVKGFGPEDQVNIPHRFPIGHFAIEVNKISVLKAILTLVQREKLVPITLFSDEIAYNSGDGSRNLKLVLSPPTLAAQAKPFFNRIIEFVQYSSK
ncbi:hypothetical protein [uncultured Shewanella sp.]|uniref:hypothetical protein n=1 Tax=uncultured Shewanella sp. TaxID=173975 RepID=UPI002609E1A7|nr:hypothetical protein [uncultured Shewanella sp.]